MTARHALAGTFLVLFGGALMAANPSARLPVLANDDAWKRLPDAPEAAQPLPAWARALAGWQPITTARMIELDAMHRTGERLDGRFRAIVRWAAADTNKCAYTKAMAAADFDRAAGYAADLPAVMKKADDLPEPDRLAALFARGMMRNAAGVTDAEVKRLIELIGEERMMALVALVAHASFQDRVILALGIEPEPAGIPAPVSTKFGRPKPKAAAKPAEPPAVAAATDTSASSPAWVRGQKGQDEQKLRPGRIRVPSEQEVTRRMGEKHPALWQNGIIWSRVAYGYQPQLTDAWFDCSSAYRQEAELDPLFTNSIFWTVTDSLNCFY
jgi:alkylhydroperoxidase family enzyme